MGDLRFIRVYNRLRDAADRTAVLRAFSDEEVVEALGATSLPEAKDPYLANVLASEALNRLRRARTMSQHVADAILQVDSQGICLDANPAAVRLLGLPRERMVGRKVADALDLRDDTGAPFVSDDPFGARLLGEGEQQGELRVRSPNGSARDIAFRSAGVDNNGDLVGAIIAIRDVTDEKRMQAVVNRSDARHNLLLDALHDYALVLLDPRGVVESWNEGARRIHGYSAEEIVGRHFRVLYTNRDQEIDLPALELALAARDGRLRGEADRMRKDGSRLHAFVDLTAIRDDSGICGFALVEDASG